MYAWKEKHPARTITVNGLWEPPPTAFADDLAYEEKQRRKETFKSPRLSLGQLPQKSSKSPMLATIQQQKSRKRSSRKRSSNRDPRNSRKRSRKSRKSAL